MSELPPSVYRLKILFDLTPAELAELFRHAADALDARARGFENDAITVALDDLSQAANFNRLAKDCVERSMTFASAATSLELLA